VPGNDDSSETEGYPALRLYCPEVISGPVRVQFETPGDYPPELVEDLDWVRDVFVRAGQLGGYAARSATADSSRVEVTGDSRGGQTGHSYDLVLSNVDSRAFQLLRNMTGSTEGAYGVVRLITVRPLLDRNMPSRELPFPEWENEDEVYPAASDKVRFAIEVEPIGFSKAHRCLIELTHPPEPADVLALAERVQAWYDLLEAGGFVFPTEDPDEDISIGGFVNQFDEYTVEVGVICLLCSGMAWNTLINIVDAYSRTSIEVNKLTIE
jgi:hypothetical protein